MQQCIFLSNLIHNPEEFKETFAHWWKRSATVERMPAETTIWVAWASPCLRESMIMCARQRKIFQKLGEAHGSSCDFTRLSFPAPQAGHVVVGAQ